MRRHPLAIASLEMPRPYPKAAFAKRLVLAASGKARARTAPLGCACGFRPGTRVERIPVIVGEERLHAVS